MNEIDSISPSDQIAFDFCVGRMAGSASGALATFPIFCLRGLPSSDIAAVVEEKSDIWRSLLVTARETLRGHGAVLAKADPALWDLQEVVRELKIAYRELANYRNVSGESASAAFDKLCSAYHRIPIRMEELYETLAGDIDLTRSVKRLRERREYDENNLRWFGNEILGATHLQPIAVG